MRTPVLCLSLLLAACVAPPPKTSPADLLAAQEPLTCKGTEQCALYWRRAQLWVIQNSAWKVQIANDVVIETFGGDRYSPLRAWRVTREPQQDGSDRIKIASGCRNTLGCHGDEMTLVAQFKRYVQGAGQ